MDNQCNRTNYQKVPSVHGHRHMKAQDQASTVSKQQAINQRQWLKIMEKEIFLTKRNVVRKGISEEGFRVKKNLHVDNVYHQLSHTPIEIGTLIQNTDMT